MKEHITCPLCLDRDFSSFLNLARHMVLSERPSGLHQQWLKRFLGLPFENYAFRKDKTIGRSLKSYWDRCRSWPIIDIE